MKIWGEVGSGENCNSYVSRGYTDPWHCFTKLIIIGTEIWLVDI